MTAVLEQLQAEQAEATQEATQRYRELVVALADGLEPTADVITETVANAGLTLDDLDSAVSTRKTRNRLREQIAAGAEAKRRRKEIEQVFAEADAKLHKAKQEHAETLMPYRQESWQLSQAHTHAISARKKLIDTYKGPLRSRVEHLRWKINQHDAIIRKLSQSRDLVNQGLEAAIATFKKQYAASNWATEQQVEDIRPRTAEIDNGRERLKRLDGEIADAQKRQAELLAEQDATLEEIVQA